ncbi:hypothetical protein CBR_g22996 [Chara braunii]|uniref:Uncharacterized protein n=1 Tax=Chara braunii TaxID=69332 RepID=A0A388L3A5_CHABU|nr:hypothetical protein CBR_g22996 [Chara braunii]|eukprot:GBG76780.1 hypothetical protein CBR_g22996 [Chara braunii]
MDRRPSQGIRRGGGGRGEEGLARGSEEEVGEEVKRDYCLSIKDSTKIDPRFPLRPASGGVLALRIPCDHAQDWLQSIFVQTGRHGGEGHREGGGGGLAKTRYGAEVTAAHANSIVLLELDVKDVEGSRSFRVDRGIDVKVPTEKRFPRFSKDLEMSQLLLDLPGDLSDLPLHVIAGNGHSDDNRMLQNSADYRQGVGYLRRISKWIVMRYLKHYCRRPRQSSIEKSTEVGVGMKDGTVRLRRPSLSYLVRNILDSLDLRQRIPRKQTKTASRQVLSDVINLAVQKNREKFVSAGVNEKGNNLRRGRRQITPGMGSPAARSAEGGLSKTSKHSRALLQAGGAVNYASAVPTSSNTSANASDAGVKPPPPTVITNSNSGLPAALTTPEVATPLFDPSICREQVSYECKDGKASTVGFVLKTVPAAV